jgi:hypothetical protein
LAGCADAAVGAEGADDGVSGSVNIFYLLEDVLENELHVGSPELVESRGAGVAIDGRAVVQRVAGGDAKGIEPVDEILVDLLAVLVIADGAFSLMALEIRERFSVVGGGGGSLVAYARFGALPSFAGGPSTAKAAATQAKEPARRRRYERQQQRQAGAREGRRYEGKRAGRMPALRNAKDRAHSGVTDARK